MTVAAVEKSSSAMGEAAVGSKARLVHSQVRRIREEDQRIGESTGEGLTAWDGGRMPLIQLGAQVGVILCSRPPMRSSSPLGRTVDPSFT